MQEEAKSFSHVLLFVTPWTTVHGILQAIMLGWVAIPFSRESSQPRDRTQVSHIAGGFFTLWATREAKWYRVKKTSPWDTVTGNMHIFFKVYFRASTLEQETFDSRSERWKETKCTKINILGRGTNSTMVLRSWDLWKPCFDTKRCYIYINIHSIKTWYYSKGKS